MLYKHNQTNQLDMELFQNPTAEYRGTPFWAWNCQLDEKELLWQIEQLKEMGFGGFHMHTRSGMATKYLSDEFMQLIKSCVEKAKQEKMLAWLYDEDRWPSGAAGGYVTKEMKYRQRWLVFTATARENILQQEEAVEQGGTYLVGCYDVVLREDGTLAKYGLYNGGPVEGTLWYAYCEVHSSFMKSPGWYNGGTYVDTMSKAAMERFVEITHERYKETVGEDFGTAVPAIFTDEPNFCFKNNLPSAASKKDCSLPWTPGLEESFREAYGYDLVSMLPELFWELPDGRLSKARYHFHDHSAELFTAAFADTCGNWCRENGIALTGHLYGEPTLLDQTRANGETMRFYRSFQIPGIDMLFNNTEFATAKQAQSAARQYGREGVMSELYGVTNWDFDFRGHKFQGDWQAALGVTVRVPHLSWVSMKGSAKRDYPASLNYQSPWYREYPLIENHFARLNTVLTRGKPNVNVAVIHPIESYWVRFGPEESTQQQRAQLEENFQNLIQWLLFDTVDFDFICESTLPEQFGGAAERLTVGQMDYSAVIVPACVTLRKTTLEILEKFADAGGTVIFAGEVPEFVDAEPSDRVKMLSSRTIQVPFTRYGILSALEPQRQVEIRDKSGKSPRQFICQLRQDGDQQYLFLANVRHQVNKRNNGSQTPVQAVIRIRGAYIPTALDTMTGTAKQVPFCIRDGITTIYYDFYEHDSLLLRLKPGTGALELPQATPLTVLSCVDFRQKVPYTRHEDNVCLLDLAEYALDEEPFQPTEEILRIDKVLRERFGWPLATGQDMQPWAMEEEKTETHSVTLRFTFESQVIPEKLWFCAEALDMLLLNGQPVTLQKDGYFVDKSIDRYPMPALKLGQNEIIAKMPFVKRESLEACFLTGDFGVLLEGCEKTLIPAGNTIGFGDIVAQGMPFYGGNLTYTVKVQAPERCRMHIDLAKYRGTLTEVSLDGKPVGKIVFAPYSLWVEDVEPGEHTLELTLYGNRHNTFGGLHNCGPNIYYGQHYWYSTDQSWSYEYNTKPTGILKSPVITMYK